MNRLDELIQEFCPNGVECKKVKEAFRRLRGTPITAGKMKEIEDSNGEIKIFAGGKTIINAKEENIPNANITRVPAVLVQSRGVIDVIYYDKPFTFKNEMWAYTADNEIEVKYLYYVLKNNIQSFRDAASGMGSLPQISLPVTEDFRIPLPPLPVQQEIVRILDNFTELTAELTAELAARRKQYEHYRDELLTFGDDVPRKKLVDSCDICRGVRVVRKQLSHADGYPVFQNSLAPLGFYDKANCCANTSFIITAGAAGSIGYSTTDFWAADDCYFFRCDKNVVLNKYLFYVLDSQQEKILSMVRKASIPRIGRSSIENLIIPIPEVSIQMQIVSILDYFDALCNNLTSGLPAEIAARQKQYEYYRDKLLTFKELEG